MVGETLKAERRKEGKSGEGKLENKEKDGKVRLGRSEGHLFCESSHVRLAGCLRHTAEKSI